MGRGASDLTASALAKTLDADACEIYTDVTGVFTADPRIVPQARKLAKVHFDEMLEMAGAGSKVLALRSVEFARNHNVPLHVRSSFTWEPGTWVTNEEPSMEDPIISGVVTDTTEAKVTVHGVPDRPGVSARAVRAARRRQHQRRHDRPERVDATGSTDISFTMPIADLAAAEDIVKQVAADVQAKGVTHDADIAKVSLVGAGMKSTPGIAATMFRVLADEDINIEMISTSTIRISVVVAARRPRTGGAHPAHRVRSRQRPGVLGAASRAPLTPLAPGQRERTRDKMTGMRRRIEFLPWNVAGRVTERQTTADDVVRTTGWVFNNETGHSLTLAEFVAIGRHRGRLVPGPLRHRPRRRVADATLVEIGCGIGRMTCAFTRRFARVVACDLDAGFLERCRETVAQFGRPDHLRTVEVADGRTLDLPTDCADYAFSFITLQHCDRDDALALTSEAMRVVRPGGRVLLNYRAHGAVDALLLPLGALARGHVPHPGVGPWLSQRRALTRLAWQANRLAPERSSSAVGGRRISDVEVWHNPKRSLVAEGAADRTFEGINPNHWWLVATVA